VRGRSTVLQRWFGGGRSRQQQQRPLKREKF
jgi:hypothetical protein